ncbi:MAG: DUF3365 domain-containing protein, partial [Cyanobacteria bacterium REEB65]|nr:DUF3365 domain-containing protein [Cyanobacteria bacterium REEB65]
EQTAKLLAVLLDSGRGVLAKNQPLINDKTKGDKGFTGAVFGTEVTAAFNKRAGIDLANLGTANCSARAKTLLSTLLRVGEEVVDDKQTVINQKGVGFKNFSPAQWGTLAGLEFTHETGVTLKQTALDFRNPKNAPDSFETKLLEKFASPAYDKADAGSIEEGSKTYRFMMPLYYKQACLSCHGGPKGTIDVSGFQREGHKVGDSAGAISVALPMQ